MIGWGVFHQVFHSRISCLNGPKIRHQITLLYIYFTRLFQWCRSGAQLLNVMQSYPTHVHALLIVPHLHFYFTFAFNGSRSAFTSFPIAFSFFFWHFQWTSFQLLHFHIFQLTVWIQNLAKYFLEGRTVRGVGF